MLYIPKKNVIVIKFTTKKKEIYISGKQLKRLKKDMKKTQFRMLNITAGPCRISHTEGAH